MTAVPKLKTLRSEPYKAFIREHPCLKCGNPNTVAAHFPIIPGASDFWCIPLCDACYKGLHADKCFLNERIYPVHLTTDRWVLVEIIRLRDEWEARCQHERKLEMLRFDKG